MTTSTSKTFGPGGQVSESVRLSQSAAARALAAQSVGLTQSQQQQQATQQRAQQTAIYAGDGNYRTLGGAGGYRPQGRVTSGGAPVGARVPANGGLMGGMPAGQRGDSGGDIEVTERLATVALERGWQVGDADPNAVGAVVNARYPQDQYLRLPERVLYYWRATVGDVPGAWVPTAEGLVIGGQDPTEPGDFEGQGYFARFPGNLWVWQPAFSPTEENPGEWFPILARNLVVNGNPDPELFPGVINGQAALNKDSNQLFVWEANEEAWLGPVGDAEILVLDAAPTVAPDRSKAVAFVRSPKEAYVWDAAAATPAWIGPYGGGGGTKIAVCNFSDSSDFEFDFRNVPWDAPRKDDFTGTFATDGQLVIPAAGWYRVSMYLYQSATDAGIDRQITYQFELTLRNAANSTVNLGEDNTRLLSFGGFSNFDPGTGQAEWTFAAPGPGRTDLFWYWYGETSGGGIISEALVSGRFMLEKLN